VFVSGKYLQPPQNLDLFFLDDDESVLRFLSAFPEKIPFGQLELVLLQFL
jgi:hypothetical protein